MNSTTKLFRRMRHYTDIAARGLLACVIAAAPVLSAQAVTVDQSPLILQKPLAPNIVLMFDDSASMGWDFMPDAEYLKGSLNGTDRPSADDLRAYQVNGIYYNPNITYTPPVKADGSSYPSATAANLTSALSDGFHALNYKLTLPDGSTRTNTEKNITTYEGDNYWYNKTSSANNFTPYSTAGFPYWKYIKIDMPAGTCPTESTLQNGQCVASPSSTPANISCPSGYVYDTSDKLCHYNGGTSAQTPTLTCASGTLNGSTCYICSSGLKYNANSGMCEKTLGNPTYSCPSGTSLNAAKTECSGPAKGNKYTCPTGLTYNSNSGQCETPLPPPTCPTGLSYNSGTGQCLGTATAPYDTCPTSQLTTVQGSGICTAPAQGGTYSCPTGYSQDSNHICSKFLTGEQCPSGQTLVNGYCTVAATYTAPNCAKSGGSLSADQTQCTAPSTHHDASCPSGSSLSPDGKTCTATATPSACPANSTSSGSLCTATATYTPAYCSTGANLSTDQTTCTATPTVKNPTCPSGSTDNGSGVCQKAPTTKNPTPTCTSPYVLQTSGQYNGQCLVSYATTTTSPDVSCSSPSAVPYGDTCFTCFTGATQVTVGGNPFLNYSNGYWSCADGTSTCGNQTIDTSTAMCVSTPSTQCPQGWSSANNGTKCQIKAFSFNKIATSTSYTPYYVVPSTTSCYGAANCATATDTSGTFAPAGVDAGTNIANWFSYYRNRMLLAKTSMTLAFQGLDAGYRVGFGSLNGANVAGIPSPSYGFTTDTKASNKLAEVEPFGDGSSDTSDPSKNTQKYNFWQWLIGEYPISNTPTRQALNAVGQYYETDQPWQTSDTDTSMYSCRSSATILTTDGFYNDTFTGVGNVDGSNGPNITTPSNYQYVPKLPFQDSYSDTLADVAMYYWENDLKTGLDNNVKTTLADPAYWQHMTTYTMGLGWDPAPLLPAGVSMKDIFNWAQTGTPPASYTGGALWPEPSGAGQGVIQNIADLAHAAVDGHGDFFSVKNPTDFLNALKSALASIADAQGSGNAVTNSGTSLPKDSTTNAAQYQFRATYFTGQWTGNLTESHWDTTTTPAAYTLDWSTSTWAPSFSVDSGVTLSNRNAWTSNALVGTPSTSVAFRELSALSGDAQTNLNSHTGIPGQTMLNYLLGDTSYDTSQVGGTLRARKAIMGDIVSSTPVYVAAPDATTYENASFTGASTYAAFVTNETSRAPMVYVAANDGMLHAIRVTAGAGYQRTGANINAVSSQPAGTEVYAYMPAAVLSQTGTGSITNLANPQYGQVNSVSGTQTVPHQYYNDGRITVQNVYFTSDSKWHTVLVGTTGRGPAKAIYALDITDPTVLMNPATAKNALLWERSAGDGQTGSNYIGEMTGAPVIAQVPNGNSTAWAVLIGNGYNSQAKKAALLQFNLQTGALTVHKTNNTSGNGLAEPGLMQPDKTTGASTYAFAGDLFGNLWKFDLTSNNSTGTIAFTAKDASGNTQPITSLVSLTYDQDTNSTYALFGTGQYLSAGDLTSTQTQTWYGVRVGINADLTGTSTSGSPVVSSTSTRANMVQRYAVNLSATTRATSAATTNDMSGKVGWYMDLPSSGERIVNRTQFINGAALVTTLIPSSADVCNPVPGGAVMIVNPVTGANSTSSIGLGTSSIQFKDASGKTVTQNVAINAAIYAAGPAAGVTGVTNATGGVMLTFNTLNGGLVNLGPLNPSSQGTGRISWRELNN